MKNKLDFYISFYEQLALKGFQAYVDHSRKHLANICVKGYNIAHFTKEDSIIPNPYAEIPLGAMEQINYIARETALKFGICTEKPYNEGIHKRLPDGSYKLAEFDNTVLSCVHHPILGYVFSTFNQPPKAVQSNECQHFYDKADAMRDFAIKSGFVDERLLFTEKEMTAIHSSLSNFVMLPDNGLGFDAGQEVDAIIYKIETAMPVLAGHGASTDLESEAELDEGVEP